MKKINAKIDPKENILSLNAEPEIDTEESIPAPVTAAKAGVRRIRETKTVVYTENAAATAAKSATSTATAAIDDPEDGAIDNALDFLDSIDGGWDVGLMMNIYEITIRNGRRTSDQRIFHCRMPVDYLNWESDIHQAFPNGGTFEIEFRWARTTEHTKGGTVADKVIRAFGPLQNRDRQIAVAAAPGTDILEMVKTYAPIAITVAGLLKEVIGAFQPPPPPPQPTMIEQFKFFKELTGNQNPVAAKSPIESLKELKELELMLKEGAGDREPGLMDALISAIDSNPGLLERGLAIIERNQTGQVSEVTPPRGHDAEGEIALDELPPQTESQPEGEIERPAATFENANAYYINLKTIALRHILENNSEPVSTDEVFGLIVQFRDFFGEFVIPGTRENLSQRIDTEFVSATVQQVRELFAAEVKDPLQKRAVLNGDKSGAWIADLQSKLSANK